jgi:hypothetical protein
MKKTAIVEVKLCKILIFTPGNSTWIKFEKQTKFSEIANNFAELKREG